MATKIEKEMYDDALKFFECRYGQRAGGVAVLKTEDGKHVISVWPECDNECASLCAETGAICEAFKLNKKITHSLCIARQEDGGNLQILSPCGICQERLMYFGDQVKCAVTTKNNELVFKTLKELQPYYWLKG